ncbi:PH domain-containing protein [Streptomyces sp. NPDC051561]|uniref:PH domain-containing protein n=1 Tax=Streptomyces sp. NPDC051561 TaxID=3365658 RepID=UPI0037BD5F32
MTSTGPSPAADGPDKSKGKPAKASTDDTTVYADRVFRSGANVFWGVLMLAVALWLGIDAMVKSDARTVWTVVAGLALVVPLVTAFLLRPAVYANEDRLRIRNPFRTVVLPWAKVDAVRTGYSSEVLADGAKYQLWAVPVSLRHRKKALRNQAKAAASDDPNAVRTPFGRGSAAGSSGPDGHLAGGDQAVRDLQELAERNAGRPEAQGEASVRWAWEILVPCLVGLVGVIVLLAL